MKTEKLTAEKPAETKKENAANRQPSVPETADKNRKLPWELVFLFIVMGITIVTIALKAFSII
ncbi:MAG TPA: hypothetical protein VHO03_06900 [Ignavibacteriales bacterium]|nr:hypothetical protein [Ignavibacteriales bacterium]